MRHSLFTLLVALTLPALLASNMGGCDTSFFFGNNGGDANDIDNGGDANDIDNGGGGGLTAVKTGITMHCQAGLRAGTDILVYGTGSITGVNYIKPALGDTAGRGITSGDTYSSYAFAVAGNKIALVNDFQVTIFDTADGTSNTIPKTDIRLASTDLEAKTIHGNGQYVGVVCDAGDVTDGNVLKAIDTTGATPAVIAFTKGPTGIQQLAVDGARVIVSTNSDAFYRFDLAQPDADPVVFDVSAQGGIGGDYWVADGGVIFYRDSDNNNAKLLDTSNAANTPVTMTANPAAGAFALGGGKFCYFADRDADDSHGSHNRSAIGTVPGPGATLAGNTMIDGSTANNNFVGWGQTCDITPGGNYTFIGGWGDMGQGGYLQYSTGGTFTVIADPTGGDAWGCPGTDPTCSDKFCGFKTGASTTTSCDETQVGYVLLP